MSFLKKIAGFALPAIGTAIAGPVGTAVGGFLGNALGTSGAGRSITNAVGSGIGTGLGNALGSYGYGGMSSGGTWGRAGLSKAQMVSQKNMYAYGANVDRDASLGQFKDRYDFIRSEGGTLTEALGVGTGSTAQGATSALGNQATAMATQNNQLQFEAQQRDADRQVQLSGQQAQLQAAQINANASVQSSQISSDATRYSSQMSLAGQQAMAAASVYGSKTQERIQNALLAFDQKQYEEVRLPQALNDIATSTPDWKRQELLARMGVDNVIATALAGEYGIDVMDPSSLAALSDSQFRDMVRQIYGYQSQVFGNTAGAAVIIEEGMDEAAKDVSSKWQGFLKALNIR